MAVPHHVLIELGSRWSSSLVLAEAEVALHRWREDAAALRPYGWGDGRRRRFEALVDRLRARHDEWSKEPAAPVTQGAPDRARAEARRWFDRAVSILEAAELDHAPLAPAIAALPPPGDGATTLVDALRAVLTTCLEHRAALDTDAADDAFFAEGAALTAAVAGAVSPDGEASDARDRAELIDTLDGEIYLTLRGLNRAAQRAFAADPERATKYVFQFLVTIQRGETPVPTRRSDAPPKG